MRLIRLHKRLDTQLAMHLRERKFQAIKYCEACGYSQTVDTHHEGEQREEHALCPNCHGLITRHIKTLEQLLSSQTSKSVQPKPIVKPLIDQFNEGYALFGKPELDDDGNPIPEYT